MPWVHSSHPCTHQWKDCTQFSHLGMQHEKLWYLTTLKCNTLTLPFPPAPSPSPLQHPHRPPCSTTDCRLLSWAAALHRRRTLLLHRTCVQSTIRLGPHPRDISPCLHVLLPSLILSSSLSHLCLCYQSDASECTSSLPCHTPILDWPHLSNSCPVAHQDLDLCTDLQLCTP